MEGSGRKTVSVVQTRDEDKGLAQDRREGQVDANASTVFRVVT